MRQGLPSFCWVWDSWRICFFRRNKSGKNCILTGIKKLLPKAKSRLQHMMWSDKMRINLKERVMPRNLTARIMTNSFKFSLHVTCLTCQLNILQQKEKPRSQKPKVSLILQVWLLKMEMLFLTNKRSNFQRMYQKRNQIYTMISTNRELLIFARQKDDRKWRIVYKRQRTCFLCLKCKN